MPYSIDLSYINLKKIEIMSTSNNKTNSTSGAKASDKKTATKANDAKETKPASTKKETEAKKPAKK